MKLDRRIVHYSALFLFWAVIVVTNVKIGDWLIGWDNLLPELSPALNIERSIFAAWQEYQGLGLLGGIGHASEITRQLLLLPFTVIFPANVIRYIWTFAMLLLGPLGCYTLISFLIRDELKLSARSHMSNAPFIGSMFYLLNIATVQNFFVPLESFSTFYGFLPWLIWSAWKYLEVKKPRSLLLYATILLLGTAAFHVQTMFVVFCILLMLLTLGILIDEGKKALPSLIALLFTTLTVNAFWLLPVGYFTATAASQTVNSKQNQVGTIETQLQNQGFGSLDQIALLKGYWFEYTDQIDGNTSYMLSTWRDHFNSPLTITLGYLIFIASIVGFCSRFLSNHNNKQAKKIVPLLLFIVTIFMLTAGVGALGFVFSSLVEIIPLFGQIFRTTFTKWVVVAGLTFSIGLAFLATWIDQTLPRLSRPVSFGIIIAFIVPMIWLVKPIFSSHLLYDEVQQQVPSAYFDLFRTLETYPAQTRILHLPLASFWGWTHTDWGYSGSGFIWYGIRQPIIDRNFDVWSSHNETFYHQLNNTLQNKSARDVALLFEQYDIDLVLVDASIAESDQAYQRLSEIDFQLVWEQDFLKLYSRRNLEQTASFVTTPSTVAQAQADLTYSRLNPVYPADGTYVDSSQKLYPFSQLGAEQLTTITYEESFATIQITLSDQRSSSNIVLPAYPTGSHFATLMTVNYSSEGVLSFNPSTGGTITISSQQIELPALHPFSIAVDPEITTVTLNVNQQPLELTQGETKQIVWEGLQVNQPVRIQYFDFDDATNTDGTIVIDSEAIIEQQVPISVWSEFQNSPQTIPLDTPINEYSTIELSIPLLSRSFLPTQPTSAKNCDIFDRGKIDKTVGFQAVTYVAQQRGAICEGFILESVSSLHSQLLRIVGQNIQGRNSKFYVENLTNSNIELETLIQDRDYDSTYALLERSEDGSYWLNFETRSVGGETAENTIERITINTVPHSADWISQIAIVSDDYQSLKNTLSLTSAQKWGTSFYSLHAQQVVGQNITDKGVIGLYQAHNPGWLAFAKTEDGDSFGLKKYKLLDHTTFNGWANAWVVPAEFENGVLETANTNQANTTSSELEIIIFYWPQLLVFIGYGLLLCTFGLLGVQAWQDRSNHR